MFSPSPQRLIASRAKVHDQGSLAPRLNISSLSKKDAQRAAKNPLTRSPSPKAS